MDRRELFSSLASSFRNASSKDNPERLLRPPYNNDVSLFHNECSKCNGKCATVCEEEIIKIADDETPYIIFSDSGCSYCDECAKVCEFDVLNINFKRKILAAVTINQVSCMSWNGVMCFSCKDPCLENAIDFKAMFMPSIDSTKCTSCGFCISRCPSFAINMKIVA